MTFASVVAMLAPMLAGPMLAEWESAGMPYLQGLIAKLGSDDEKLAATALLGALDVIAKAEIPKI